MRTDCMLYLYDTLLIQRRILHITQIDSIVGLSRRSSYRYIAVLREFIYFHHDGRYELVSDGSYYNIEEIV